MPKNALFSKTNVQTIFFGLIQAPNTSKHIHVSRNRGPIIKASQKTAHDKVFILGQKVHFFPKHGDTIKKKVIALKLYIGTNVLVYER